VAGPRSRRLVRRSLLRQGGGAVGKETNGLIGFIVFFLIAAVWLWFLTSGGIGKIFEAISGDKDEAKSE
jgi:TM2 domain-containing membrane protein YozV